MLVKVLVCVFLLVQLGATSPRYKDVKHMHTHYFRQKRSSPITSVSKEENSANYWVQQAQLSLNAKLGQKINTNVAKNVIMFLGDGMSLPTLAATRAYWGQMNGKTGEEVYLSFEEFPYTALSKTYCVDSQVADSACSATAYLCGVKANLGTIGVTASVHLGECEVATNTSTHVTSISKWSQLKGKKTGIVTTTRVTHASPSGAYSHTAHRDWESDFDTSLENVNTSACKDIADQLINGETGSNFNVILGGGRVKMLPYTQKDEEGINGERLDGRNLIREWLEAKKQKNQKATYVWDRDGLLSIPNDTEYLLGLFESSHCTYNLDRTDAEPTLAEMMETAIQLLSKGDKGYFLFVEGGRIDHAHHDTKVQKALDETVQFSEAIKRARELTNEEDTLIVVTADHAHTLSVNGYPDRGNDILGVAGIADDKLPYSTLSYSNGPGYVPERNGRRHDLSEDDMHDKEYKFPALAPLDSETHGGEDVGVFAVGPWAHLFRGVIEQNVIPHIMAYASCVGNGITACDN